MKADEVPEALANIPCSIYPTTQGIKTKPLAQMRIGIVSTAGLMHRGEKPFSLGAVDYRILDSASSEDLMMSHISTNFDRSGFAADSNLVLPLDRLKEKASSGEIGSVAQFHYSFMGATEPEKMKAAAEQLITTLKGDEVDGLILVPV
ncbi:MAG: D-proline reductase (dithiol) PrdB [Candidatus Azotimanducaceae bacterium]|jgi:D-proline reductase (dithiol) PrdB